VLIDEATAAGVAPPLSVSIFSDALPLKGIGTVRAFAATRETTLGAEETPPPLIGRDVEMAALRSFVRGEGVGMLFLAGPHGIGKSALMSALAADFAAAGGGASEGGCGGGGGPLRVRVAALKSHKPWDLWRRISLALERRGDFDPPSSPNCAAAAARRLALTDFGEGGDPAEEDVPALLAALPAVVLVLNFRSGLTF
jgi:hypothetical protein